MFDHCPESIKDVSLRLSKEPKIKSITQNTMETFEWKSDWNCIVLRYCVGYLDDMVLAKVLKRAVMSLTDRSDNNKDPT